ncbi:hypothetical protein Scep_015744 [Stephania cephalantha]|uniref:Uncharacterized protein n=1 Tax=Stephania cephalantha TaxID=152367 RepID=A0AAP0J3S6_9MAGN
MILEIRPSAPTSSHKSSSSSFTHQSPHVLASPVTSSLFLQSLHATSSAAVIVLKERYENRKSTSIISSPSSRFGGSTLSPTSNFL